MLRGVALISRTEPLHKDPDALLLRGLIAKLGACCIGLWRL